MRATVSNWDAPSPLALCVRSALGAPTVLGVPHDSFPLFSPLLSPTSAPHDSFPLFSPLLSAKGCAFAALTYSIPHAPSPLSPAASNSPALSLALVTPSLSAAPRDSFPVFSLCFPPFSPPHPISRIPHLEFTAQKAGAADAKTACFGLRFAFFTWEHQMQLRRIFHVEYTALQSGAEILASTCKASVLSLSTPNLPSPSHQSHPSLGIHGAASSSSGRT
ncbi:unnamed protein product [Closterium sp. NIES-65]|nr:unnamed protein product [Closterium sp. NIES-65]